MKKPTKKNSHKFQEESKVTFDNIVTRSEEMRSVIKTAKKVSSSDVTVLITGESGTGKELVARAIHNNSPRKDGPFVTVNCAGMPDTLLESELFGHEKGAYTDATSTKKGRFELANEGTLFLDEVADLSPAAQAKTLRAVEEKEFERVGGEESIYTNCRIIAATNKDLLTELREGRFREDLYYRLHEVPLYLPPLRERKEDISPLIELFIKEFNTKFAKKIEGVSNVTLAYLMRHDWPGNVRELKSLIRSTMALIGRDVIWLEDLPFKIELIDEKAIHRLDQDLSLKIMEQEHILKVLNFTDWNKSKAANLLKISRPTLDKKIKEYRLET
ncbi:MAG: sigma-54-dependent Fis family transcriptional regulator [Candidatus Omnitrophica bacterium]|nr:sigma-54-dependent Fis family transcriptional regulator [Candidatus Omnitrophota bacterium]